MKEIIPINKELKFKSKIGKIISTDLEEEHKITDDSIEGIIHLNGTYKITEASLIEEEFNFDIPYSISISSDIDKDSINIDIDNFDYDYDEYTLKIDISLELNCDKDTSNELFNVENLEEYFNDNELDTDIVNIKDNKVDSDIVNVKDNEINTNINDISSSIVDSNINDIVSNSIIDKSKYDTYKVYIMRENDNIDTICNKYNVNMNDLKLYNDLSNLTVGDKVIIPFINE